MISNILGIVMVYAVARLVISNAAKEAWRLCKLSAFPYLGLILPVMYLDILLLE